MPYPFYGNNYIQQPSQPYYQQPNIQQMPQQQYYNGGVAYVNGIEGAKAYYVMPNTCVFLLDSDRPYLYKKISDTSGRASLETFKLIPENEINTTSNDSNNRIDAIEKKIDEILQALKSNVTQNEEVKENG